MNLSDLETSATRFKCLKDATDAEREIRNRLIVEAKDAGYPVIDIARAADVSTALVHLVLTGG